MAKTERPLSPSTEQRPQQIIQHSQDTFSSTNSQALSAPFMGILAYSIKQRGIELDGLGRCR